MVDTLILILPVPKGSFSCEIVIVIPSCKKGKKEENTEALIEKHLKKTALGLMRRQ